ncbi:hypothetical protein Tco_0916451 [Tanacetum coccineum]
MAYQKHHIAFNHHLGFVPEVDTPKPTYSENPVIGDGVAYVLGTPRPEFVEGDAGTDKEVMQHFKAYRFYVIEPNDFVYVNSVIESRDAIFDENRFSSIPRPKDIVSSSNGTQCGDLPVEGSRDEIASQYSYCYSIEEDPKTFDEAMKSRDVSF